jgi:14-3-3 protein epsilon
MAELKPAPGTLERSDALFLARLAEQAERYEEMVLYMKRIVQLGIQGDELTVEERNLISVGYKNMMSVRRTAWRQIVSHKANLANETELPISADKATELSSDYQKTISNELFNLITEVSNEIVKVYVEGPQKADDPEVLVFFHKMEGDYNRYGAEITEGAEREVYKSKAEAAYEKAQKMGSHLKETNPIRLGLALNYSVFFYEICEKKAEASDLAQAAFDNAIELLDGLDEEAYRDSTLIMQLLKDNLQLWADTQEDPGDQ